ncbi:MAG: SDR family NAD(P)-dependent oxidoreductase [Oscillospiraceae bacterium]|nr:SDR family NAD(P)-dependent oxidoreductase [Oscillospiraceae bacterium]MDD4368613.1 SDR family NAD(P)-dependent oxidoreductase [Oscillospiraceae bacterium]
MPAISQDQAGTAADKGPGIVIVTGASSGLGREFAGQLARDYPAFCGELWLLARRESRLQQLQAQLQPLCPCRILVLDLLTESAWQKLAQELAQAARPVCGLVNAAGIGRPGHFAAQPEAFQLQLLRLDAEVPVRLCHLVLPYLITGGRIWNVASVSAFSPQPGFALYAAVKAMILSFSRALNAELKPKGIAVTAVCPNPLRHTGFFKAQGLAGPVQGLKRLTAEEPARVVRLALRRGLRGKDISVSSFWGRLLSVAARLLPVRVWLGLEHLLGFK